MNTHDSTNVSNEDIGRIVLERLGLIPSELLPPQVTPNDVPTFNAYIPVVIAAVSDATRRTYSPYWATILEHWAELKLTEPTPSQIKQLARLVQANIVVRRNSRDGRGAVELFIAALRCVFRHAVDDRLITETENAARRVPKPPRLPSGRFALPPDRLMEINTIGAQTGNDPMLDALLLRLHEETACRRGGALALRNTRDLDRDECLIRLREKGGTVRWQPVSPTLMSALVDHANERGARPGEPLLRYSNGNPLTRRRYDHLWNRIGRHLSWANALQVSTHWLRYTTLTWVERNFSYAVARAYAGHLERSSEIGSTVTYVKAGLHEVATALSVLTGEHHPLARTDPAFGYPTASARSPERPDR